MNSKTLLLIQEQLREIGIRMKIEELPFDEYIEKVFRKKDYDSSFAYLVARPFTDYNFVFWHSSQIGEGNNFSSYSNPEIDRLLEEARTTLDPESQKAAYIKFQEIFHDDPPGILLFWRDMPIAVHKRFKGIPEKRMESLRDLVNVWEDKSEM